MSPRWLIGLMTFWLFCTIISNIVNNESRPLRTSELTVLSEAGSSNITETSDPQGGVAMFWNSSRSALENIYTILTFDYDFFYDVNPTTGIRTGNWGMIFRWFLLAVGVGIIFLFVIQLRQIIFG